MAGGSWQSWLWLLSMSSVFLWYFCPPSTLLQAWKHPPSLISQGISGVCNCVCSSLSLIFMIKEDKTEKLNLNVKVRRQYSYTIFCASGQWTPCWPFHHSVLWAHFPLLKFILLVSKSSSVSYILGCNPDSRLPKKAKTLQPSEQLKETTFSPFSSFFI